MIPAPEYINSTMVRDGRTNDIIDQLAKVQPVAARQLKDFAAKYLSLSGGDPLKYAFVVARYIQYHFPYRKDDFVNQNIQLPARLNADKYGDCKSFSLFFSAAMSAAGIENGFRFCAYRAGNFTHVYNFIVVNGKKLIFDTCVPGLKETKHLIHEDMNVNVLSGPETARSTGRLFSVTMVNPVTKKEYGLNVRATSPEAAKEKIYSVMNGIGDPEEYIGRRSKAERKAKRADKRADKKEKKAGRKQRRKENKPFRKVAMAPGRGAMLLLIGLNVRNWAVKLSKMAPADVKSFWKRLGGDYSKIEAAINKGKTKKRLLGPEMEITAQDFEGLGDPATATAALVTAAPIIAALVKLFKSKGVSDKDDAATEKELKEDGVEPLGEGFEVTDPAPGSEEESAGFGPGQGTSKSVKRSTAGSGSGSGSGADDGASSGGFELSPMTLGLGALGLYLLTK